MSAAVVAQIVEHDGRVLDDRAAALFLAVEDAKRILCEPLAAGRAHLVDVRAEILFERGVVVLAALATADAVEVQFERLYPEPLVDGVQQRDDLDVRRRRRTAEKFDAELVMLAKSARLRSLIAEDRGDVVHLGGLSVGVERVLDESPRDAGGALGLQCHRPAALVVKGVHLLVDDVGGVADSACEQLGVFEDGGAYLADAILCGDASDHAFDVVPFVGFGRGDVLCSLW